MSKEPHFKSIPSEKIFTQKIMIVLILLVLKFRRNFEISKKDIGASIGKSKDVTNLSFSSIKLWKVHVTLTNPSMTCDIFDPKKLHN